MKTFRALTVSQPYASLIARGEKWVENRTWNSLYRGPLLIHAGKGTQFLTRDELEQHPTGQIIAIVRMTGCLNVAQLKELRQAGRLDPKDETAAAVLDHEYTTGPYGWTFAEATPLPEPIPASGKQGIWVLDRFLAAKAAAVLEKMGAGV